MPAERLLLAKVITHGAPMEVKATVLEAIKMACENASVKREADALAELLYTLAAGSTRAAMISAALLVLDDLVTQGARVAREAIEKSRTQIQAEHDFHPISRILRSDASYQLRDAVEDLFHTCAKRVEEMKLESDIQNIVARVNEVLRGTKTLVALLALLCLLDCAVALILKESKNDLKEPIPEMPQ